VIKKTKKQNKGNLSIRKLTMQILTTRVNQQIMH